MSHDEHPVPCALTIRSAHPAVITTPRPAYDTAPSPTCRTVQPGGIIIAAQTSGRDEAWRADRALTLPR